MPALGRNDLGDTTRRIWPKLKPLPQDDGDVMLTAGIGRRALAAVMERGPSREDLARTEASRRYWASVKHAKRSATSHNASSETTATIRSGPEPSRDDHMTGILAPPSSASA